MPQWGAEWSGEWGDRNKTTNCVDKCSAHTTSTLTSLPGIYGYGWDGWLYGVWSEEEVYQAAGMSTTL